MPENEREPASTACSLPISREPEADLIQKLACLETRIETLQEQIAQLALALLQEQNRAAERRISMLEIVVQELVEKSAISPLLPDQEAPVGKSLQVGTAPAIRQLNPAEQLARSRMPPLIEYSAQEGELHLVPDSQEWFDWLASLTSFRFVGA